MKSLTLGGRPGVVEASGPGTRGYALVLAACRDSVQRLVKALQHRSRWAGWSLQLKGKRLSLWMVGAQ